jgi:hypothetical protein
MPASLLHFLWSLIILNLNFKVSFALYDPTHTLVETYSLYALKLILRLLHATYEPDSLVDIDTQYLYKDQRDMPRPKSRQEVSSETSHHCKGTETCSP